MSHGRADAIESPETFVADLGGHAIRGGGTMRVGLLFRISGGLGTAADAARLDSAGLRLLVDLRGEHEDRSALMAYAQSQGIEYHHQPIAWGSPAEMIDAVRRHAGSIAEGQAFLVSVYRQMVDENGPALAAAVAATACVQPAGFGCAAGKDRTGLLAALLQDLLGVERSAIMADYVARAPTVARLRQAVGGSYRISDADFDRPGFATILGAAEETMAATLEYIDARYGGAAAYLESAGLPSSTVAVLRSELVVPAGG